MIQAELERKGSLLSRGSRSVASGSWQRARAPHGSGEVSVTAVLGPESTEFSSWRAIRELDSGHHLMRPRSDSETCLEIQ